MSASRSRASDLAAQQVEQIVAAAQDAADRIRDEAQSERKEARAQGKRDAERMRKKAQGEIEAARQRNQDVAESELNEARKQAVMLSQEARSEAESLVAQAKQEADQLREQTDRAVEGRVAAAEKAASQVLDEAQALSGGLRQLGRSLEDQADRILRDVQAAHKRMQADLRVESGEDVPLSSSSREPRNGGRTRSEPAERDTPAPRSRSSAAGARRVPPRQRANPFDDLEVPGWSSEDRS